MGGVAPAPIPIEQITRPSRSIAARNGGTRAPGGKIASNAARPMSGAKRNSIRATSGRVAMA